MGLMRLCLWSSRLRLLRRCSLKQTLSLNRLNGKDPLVRYENRNDVRNLEMKR